MIFKSTLRELDEIVPLALKLWPGHSKEEFNQEFTEYITGASSAVFAAFADEKIIGFAHAALRHDYVEGTSSSPVGYLEGIYIEESYRKQGYARQLVKACEEWSLSQGCSEFASDVELDNDDSYAFHIRAGFTEANRIICFTKKLT